MERTPTRVAGLLVWPRALVLSVVAVLAGVLAHVAAHGLLPGPLVLAGLLVVGTAAGVPLLRAPASTGRVVLLLVVGQALVHAVLTAVAGHHDGTELPTMPAPQGPALWLAHLAEDLDGPHAVMAAGHALAAGVVGLWLARGEAAAWTLVRLAGGTVLRRARSPRLPAVLLPPRVVPVPHPVPPLPPRVLARSLPRRGPPTASTA